MPAVSAPATNRSRQGRIQHLLDSARAALHMDAAFVTALDGTQQTLTHLSSDERRTGLELGKTIPRTDGFCHHMLAGDLPNAVPDTNGNEITARLLATSDGEAQIGSYVGVPLTLDGGRVYGAVCVTANQQKPELGSSDVAFLNFLARLIAEELTEEEHEAAARAMHQRELGTWLAPGGLMTTVQPIVDLASGTVRGLEALSRFPGHVGNPDEVFSAAERVGMGAELEVAAVRSALRLLPLVPEHVYLAVNVSPSTARDPRLHDVLFSVPGDRIVLELTEHVPFSDYVGLVGRLRELNAHGVRIAIDDAGSGYAGLQIILALAPDVIKLDIALVKNVNRDPVRRSLVRALAGFASESGAVIVAEGIETRLELETLRDLGVTLGQGFHIARPAPIEQLRLTG
jgi:EAL domain-containing protein (putative c-di-GMP-specific phosphodiesterase class I)